MVQLMTGEIEQVEGLLRSSEAEVLQLRQASQPAAAPSKPQVGPEAQTVLSYACHVASPYGILSLNPGAFLGMVNCAAALLR